MKFKVSSISKLVCQQEKEMEKKSNVSKVSCLILAMGLALLCVQGCVGKAIGVATDATIEVAKVPFKVVGATWGLVKGNKDEQEQEGD